MITLALIGKGAWGKNYIRTISSLKNCQLPQKYIKTKDYQELFHASDIDGVIIATPPSTHFSIAKECLSKGMHVLIEKPMTTKYSDAVKLYDIAEKNNKVLMVGHIYLSNPAFIKTKQLVKKMKPLYISFEGMNFGPMRPDISALWDYAPHDIAMAIDMFDELPQYVTAYAISIHPETKMYDMCYIKLEFSKISAVIAIGRLSPVKKRTMTIMGKNEAIIYDEFSKNKIMYITNLSELRQTSYPTYSASSPLLTEINEFVFKIKDIKKQTNKIKMGAEVVKILEICEKSIQQHGKRIKNY